MELTKHILKMLFWFLFCTIFVLLMGMAVTPEKCEHERIKVGEIVLLESDENIYIEIVSHSSNWDELRILFNVCELASEQKNELQKEQKELNKKSKKL